MSNTFKKILIFSLVAILGIFFIFFLNSQDSKDSKQAEIAEKKSEIKQVKTLKLNNYTKIESSEELLGVVKPMSQIDVISLASGNVQNLNFKVGDTALQDQVLVSLYDASTLINKSNARSNFLNNQSNKVAIERLAEEGIRQAEINKKSAKEAMNSALAGVEAIQVNLNNKKILQEKNFQDATNSAIVSYYNFQNFISRSLDQINYLLNIDDGPYLSAAERVLGVKNQSSLDNAKEAYLKTKHSFINLKSSKVNDANIDSILKNLITSLSLLQESANAVNLVLNNTIASSEFSVIDLEREKTTYYNLEVSIIANLSSAITTLQNLEKFPIANKNEIDILESQLRSAKIQYDLAAIKLVNAEATLESAKLSKYQQAVSAEAQVSAASGQLDLAQAQLDFLIIKAPIPGVVIERFVELGTKVSPGQKIATIAQADFVKIFFNINLSDVPKYKIGDSVIINENLKGTINTINPSADPLTRKVQVQAIFNNSKKELTIETFAKISLLQKKDQSSNIIEIPLKAVKLSQDAHSVFVLDYEYKTPGLYSVKKIKVELGKIKAENIEILKGLSFDDQIIINPQSGLKEGDLVSIE